MHNQSADKAREVYEDSPDPDVNEDEEFTTTNPVMP